MEPTSRPIDNATTLSVRAWPDAVIDRLGFPPASAYVELCWLPVLGPTATWALRRLAGGLHANPDGYRVRLAEFAAGLGLGTGTGQHSQVMRSLRRLVVFGMATYDERDAVFAVRRRIPPLAQRQAVRLLPALQRAHAELLARRDDTAQAS